MSNKLLWMSPRRTNEHKGKVGTFRSDGQNGNVNVVKEFPQAVFMNNTIFFLRSRQLQVQQASESPTYMCK